MFCSRNQCFLISVLAVLATTAWRIVLGYCGNSLQRLTQLARRPTQKSNSCVTGLLRTKVTYLIFASQIVKKCTNRKNRQFRQNYYVTSTHNSVETIQLDDHIHGAPKSRATFFDCWHLWKHPPIWCVWFFHWPKYN